MQEFFKDEDGNAGLLLSAGSIATHISSYFLPQNISTTTSYVAFFSGILGAILISIKIYKEVTKK